MEGKKEETKQKATVIIKNHLDTLEKITVENYVENPILLFVATESIKQLVGLILTLDRL